MLLLFSTTYLYELGISTLTEIKIPKRYQPRTSDEKNRSCAVYRFSMHHSQLLNKAGTDTTLLKQEIQGTLAYKYYDFHAESIGNIFLKAYLKYIIKTI
jgi:hypothetical protein